MIQMALMDRLMRYGLRKVIVKKEMLVGFIDSMDANGDGYISLAEAADALRYLWKKAKGKLKEPKTQNSKISVLE